MARTRTPLAELGRLLNAARQPIYMLDDEHRIGFANEALLDWTGLALDDLLRVRCVYASTVEGLTPAEVRIAPLCPPPAALAGDRSSATLAWPSADGAVRRRRAEFLPLAGSSRLAGGLLAILAAADLDAAAPDDTSAADDEAGRLHERIVRFRRAAAERFRMDQLLGDSPAMRRARTQAALAAEHAASVLIAGPPGSGRQRIASAIHYGSRVASAGPLIPLACSIVGAELIEETVRAAAGRRGVQTPAVRATLLLNDVDQLAAEAQSALAAALAGAGAALRVIATAQTRLEAAVAAGRFREDLAAVLATMEIVLPALAERAADIPLLAQAFVEEANARGTKQLAGFTPEALDLLAAYTWPKNLDELAETVRAAHGRAQGPRITPADLPERMHLAFEAAIRPRRREERIVLDEFLGRVERELIERALMQAKGNKSKAAKLLGLTRPRLYRRLVQLGLEPARPPRASREPLPSAETPSPSEASMPDEPDFTPT